MQTITLDKFRDTLKAAGVQHGQKGVLHQKKLILDKFMLVDENGMAIDPESVDIAIVPAAGTEDGMAEDTTMDAMDEMTEEKSANDGAVTIAAVERAVTKGLRALGNAGPRFSVAATPALPSPRVYGRLKAFSNDATGRESAYRFGTWCLAAMGHAKSAEFCRTKGLGLIRQKGHVEGINSAGGFLVPEEFDNELITLREQYGVFRRNASIKPMTSDTKIIPKRKSTLTAYFVGEAAQITESQQTFDSVQLVAKKIAVLTTISSELSEDAVVNLGDDVASEIAYAFALKEDGCGFLGDGTSTYGGIVGLDAALTDATYQVSDGGASNYAGVSLAEITDGIKLLPQWATQRNGVKIYCSKHAFHAVFERLTYLAGGATFADYAAGAQPKFMGYPVEFTQVIPVSETAGATFAFIGDLSLGCYMGDRRSTTIAFSDSALNAFEQDELAVRGTERFDIVCANVGGATETGAVVKMTL